MPKTITKPDPDDFTDNTPEGQMAGERVTKSEQLGVGGLSVSEAENSYKRANSEHFKTEDPKNISPQTTTQNRSRRTKIPQIGSVDDRQESSVSQDIVGGVTISRKDT